MSVDQKTRPAEVSLPLQLGGKPSMDSVRNLSPSASPVEVLCAQLEGEAMKGLWEVQGRPELPSELQPYVWQWKKVRNYLERAGEVMQLHDSAVRRALLLWNPGARDHWDTTNTLTAAVQMMLPGEKVITHRHIHTALRFITHGGGATTTVNGGKIVLSAGDLVLTPNWAWHDHAANESSEPIIWMDGVDRPLVKMLDAVFFEVYKNKGYQPVIRTGDAAAYQTDLDGLSPERYSPQLAFRWNDTWRTLDELSKNGQINPFDDVLHVFRNPVSGGFITPTMGAAIQMLRPSVHTKAHRHTSSAVYHVYRGRGSTVIDGQQYDWEEGDYFALPPRQWHEHINSSQDEPAILFSIDDRPAYESLGLYREEALTNNGGYQKS